MSLFSHETTVAEAVADIEAEIAEIDDELENIAEEAAAHDALAATKSNLEQQQSVLEAYVEHGEWGEDAEIVLSSVSAGERAIVNGEMQDDAGRYRRTLWTVAAATDEAPWAGDSVTDTFANVVNLEAPVVDWCESVVGGLRGEGHPLSHLRRTVISQQSTEISGSAS